MSVFGEASSRRILNQLETSGILIDPSDCDLLSGLVSGNAAAGVTNRFLAFQNAPAELPKTLILRDFWPDLGDSSSGKVWEHIFLCGLSLVGHRFPLILVSAKPEVWTKEHESLDVDLTLFTRAADLYFSPKLVRRRKILEGKLLSVLEKSRVQNRFGRGLHWRLQGLTEFPLQRRESFPDRFFHKGLTFLQREDSFYLGVPLTTPFEHLEPKLVSLREFLSSRADASHLN
ncbi:MAG: hypothetical protein JNM63_02365 [Spirochaetia bacterium]|nr:hypothetical protein [Spirochaetia bacterium]